MMTISHRELRNNSGEVLRRVAAGESILVTNNGVPAALLSPPPSSSVRERLLAEGVLRPATRPRDIGALPPRVTSSVPTEALLAEDRDER